ncbi:MAG: hypothetical protein A2504_11170 [Bdellovibrionales bacterium RIFOXYD12_FULL_39_22]|nr:MAG: hypothetical protein A2385_09735 [Bdellovibrionales bacterium RIFOXYB1_FULL_39_21]OFZ44235.1 MAG: hypothetical protein A2485_07355 [Bdellovibrionales bacterium RIFOXYC12_FULL_39_17]OFZ46777.1 MAG: hypothetical protein A2404_04590 [Bdellovibrionales bacterium RIFOXYC1_FULL_39_130]OFZ72127.1 MAG: hypothetical protein A2451_13765 [Bdellovibrionales bacterium RIFOXYC2_FULL_39_8]OFZ75946.1 MAG: hypothetical protein A2560_02560 [Bdellovibrionales bacterium RIFOXYD1_FULL_39_84]OFZ95456.1 MAG:
MRATSWNNWKKTWDHTTYDMTSTNHTIIEGDLSIPKISTKIGFNLQQDSGDLSKIKQYAGYLGFGYLSVKAERGKFTGTAHYKGLVSSEQSADINFDQIYSYTELDYNMAGVLPKGVQDFHYLGLRYTKWQLPSEIILTQESKAYTVIDPDYKTEFYSFILGEDSFTNELLYNSENWKPGLDWIRSYVLGVGYGHCSVGSKAIRAAKSLYNLTMTETDYDILAGHISGQLGPMYGLALGGLRMAIGIAYDVNFLFVGKSPFSSQGMSLEYPAIDSGKAAVDTFPMFLYHGPIFRAHAAF